MAKNCCDFSLLRNADVSRSSLPQLARCQASSLGQRREFQPGDARMCVVEPERGGGEAAVSAGDDILAADQFREAQDSFGHQFRMLHEVGGVADDPRYQYLTCRQLDPLEDVILVLMARIGRFE